MMFQQQKRALLIRRQEKAYKYCLHFIDRIYSFLKPTDTTKNQPDFDTWVYQLSLDFYNYDRTRFQSGLDYHRRPFFDSLFNVPIFNTYRQIMGTIRGYILCGISHWIQQQDNLTDIPRKLSKLATLPLFNQYAGQNDAPFVLQQWAYIIHQWNNAQKNDGKTKQRPVLRIGGRFSAFQHNIQNRACFITYLKNSIESGKTLPTQKQQCTQKA